MLVSLELRTADGMHGPAGRDSVRREFARILGNSFRDSDVVARLGDDEFCVLLSPQLPDDVDIPIGRLEQDECNRRQRSGPRFCNVAQLEPVASKPVTKRNESRRPLGTNAEKLKRRAHQVRTHAPLRHQMRKHAPLRRSAMHRRSSDPSTSTWLEC